MLRVFQLEVGGFDHNFSYLITDEKEAALVDPTGDLSIIQNALKQAGDPWVKYVFLTHIHHDHIEHMHAFGNAEIIEHKNSFNHQLFSLETAYFELIFSPGHTRDSVLYRLTNPPALFTGDTLFIGSCGFCEPKTMFNTLHNVINELPDELEVYSGHDYGICKHRSLGIEKKENIYLNAPDFLSFSERLKTLE